MFAIAGIILEQPNIIYQGRFLLEVQSANSINKPLDSALGAIAHDTGLFVTNHHERLLQNNGKILWYIWLQFHNVLGVISIGKTDGGFRNRNLSRSKIHVDCKPAVFFVLERPKIKKPAAFHTTICTVLFRRFMVYHLLGLRVISKNQAKVL